MAYNPENNRRIYLFPRQKTLSYMEAFLPHYLNIISDICKQNNVTYELFKHMFRLEFRSVFGNENDEKTIDNHMTENAGTFLGLYYFEGKNDEKLVFKSPFVKILLDNGDYTSHFRRVCENMQIPNGLKKPHKVLDDFNRGYILRPVHFIISLLLEADKRKLTLCRRDLYNYVLSNVDIFKSKVSPSEVATYIENDINRTKRVSEPLKAWEFKESDPVILSILKKTFLQLIDKSQFYSLDKAQVEELAVQKPFVIYGQQEHDIVNQICTNTPKEKATSYTEQHSRELINLMSMAGIIITDNSPDAQVNLAGSLTNDYEEISSNLNAPLNFDITSFLNTSETGFTDSKYLESTWSEFWANGGVMPNIQGAEKILHKNIIKAENNAYHIGRLGEAIVKEYEKDRISKWDKNYIDRICDRSKEPNLGYDIESIKGNETTNGSTDEKFIEVKTTKKSSSIDLKNPLDSFNLELSQWKKAQKDPDKYSIYRIVVLNNKEVYMIKIVSPANDFSIYKQDGQKLSLDIIGKLKVIFNQSDYEIKKIPTHILDNIPNEYWVQ